MGVSTLKNWAKAWSNRKRKSTVSARFDEMVRCFRVIHDRVKKPFHRSVAINHLLTTRDRESELSHDLHDIHGSLDGMEYQTLKKCLFYLISNDVFVTVKRGSSHLLLPSNKDFPAVSINKFNEFEMPVNEKLFFDQHALETHNEPSDSYTSCQSDSLPEASSLINQLKDWRKRTALEKGIPLYMVVHNNALESIAKHLPRTPEELFSLKGVGPKVVELYGNELLSLVNGDMSPESEEPIRSEDPFRQLFGQGFVSYRESRTLYERFIEGSATFSKEHASVLSDPVKLETIRKSENDQLVQKLLVSEKDYLDTILNDVDPNIRLDIKQREVVLRDEDHTLVVAGAGSGKTTTIAAKVKYLVDKKGINPESILIVSYTNDAVNELKDRINVKLNIPAVITTFHKTGYAIIRKHKEAERMRIVHDGLIFNVIRDYLSKQLQKNPEELKSLILFFGYYIDAPLTQMSLDAFVRHFQRNDFTTLKTNINDIASPIIEERKKKHQTIKREIMRSLEEVQIANFLYLNSVEYEYEGVYPYHIDGSKQLYTPDFTITHNGKTVYLEHFGISESGKHSRYSEHELNTYKAHVRDKILLHRSKGTKLIYTFSKYNDGRSLLEHLKEELEKTDITLVERSCEEIYDALIGEESNKYFNKFTLLLMDFISSFKTNGYSESDFEMLYNKNKNVRTRLFLKIVKPIYLHYQQFLSENDAIDFQDMINESTRLLNHPDTINLIPDFKYVIVDEYQDISRQRFDLTKKLSELTEAKIIAVGDDWQSIFAFAGSRIDLFLEFSRNMKNPDVLTIDYTYRNAQEAIDIAGHFIQKNESQLKKQLKSPKHITKPVILYEYSDIVTKNERKGFKGIIHEKAKICDRIIGEILAEHGRGSTIAILGRYNFEHKQMIESDFFNGNDQGQIWSVNHPEANILFLTVHRSKGLGFDHVIVLNGSDGTFGFPTQIEMDPLLRMVKFDDRTITFAEERRLFYVALTRTKNRTHILYPKTRPSTFVKELARDYKLVDHPSTITDSIPLHDRKDKRCPICDYPLQLKENKAYGLKLFMCSNEPEICGYMTNNLRSGRDSITKCPSCKTGFLIVKHSKKTGDYFFGCTNYRSDGKGCNHTIPIDSESAPNGYSDWKH
jgi:DNA helicase IV